VWQIYRQTDHFTVIHVAVVVIVWCEMCSVYLGVSEACCWYNAQNTQSCKLAYAACLSACLSFPLFVSFALSLFVFVCEACTRIKILSCINHFAKFSSLYRGVFFTLFIAAIIHLFMLIWVCPQLICVSIIKWKRVI